MDVTKLLQVAATVCDWRIEGLDEQSRGASSAPRLGRDRALSWKRIERSPVFLYVGRFTAVKRLPLLIGAHARAVERLGKPAPLVLVGGHPGEWEGEHPLAAARRIGNRQVFLAAGVRTRSFPTP